MKISVIVPVYNILEKYLRNCLESLKKQTLEDLEFIIIDDGSTNNAPQICDEYGIKDNRFKVIHQENVGVSAARNNGLDTASGEFILFVDADDSLLDGEVCNRLYTAITQNAADIVVFKYIKSSQLKEKTRVATIQDEFYRSLSVIEISDGRYSIISRFDDKNETLLGSPWGKIFKREFIESNKLRFVLNLKKAQDRVFMLECFSKTNKIGILNLFCYCYNDLNETSICHKMNPNILNILEQMDQEMLGITSGEMEEQLLQSIYMMRIQNILEYLHLSEFHPDNNNSIFAKVKNIGAIISLDKYEIALHRLSKENNSKFKKDRRIKIFLLKHKLVFIYVLVSMFGKKMLGYM